MKVECRFYCGADGERWCTHPSLPHGERPSPGTCMKICLLREKPVAGSDKPNRCAEPVRAVPRDKWPTWAASLANLAISGDAGVGDVVERLARRSGVKITVEFLKSIGIPDCGCADRRARWNAQYPLRK